MLTPQQTVAASENISLIPEFHDCQRLMKSSEMVEYGPLVALFVRINADAVPDPVTTVQLANTNCEIQLTTPITTTVGGTGFATIRVLSPAPNRFVCAPSVTTVQPTQIFTGKERAVVTVYNYDEPYPQLSIPSGWSCVYLFHEDGEWAAQIIPVDDDEKCVLSVDVLVGGTPLQVRVIDEGTPPPPVARWDWDGSSHFIGVRCGTKWCELYQGDAELQATSATYYVSGTIKMHKGSYDEQYLAEPMENADGNDQLKPGAAMGTISSIPWPTSDEPAAGEWTTVARASLSLDSEKYEDRFGFKGAAVGSGSEIALCKGRKIECVSFWHLFPGKVNSCDQVVDDNGTADRWWARISKGKKVVYRCVIRRKHPQDAPEPPDVVRWRWDINDEGIWRRCANGCCEVT